MNPKTIPKSLRNVNLCAFRLLALGRNLFVSACWLLWIDQSLPEFHGYLRMSGSVPDFWWGFWGWFVGMAWLQKHPVSLSSARLIVVFLWMCWSWSKSLFWFFEILFQMLWQMFLNLGIWMFTRWWPFCQRHRTHDRKQTISLLQALLEILYTSSFSSEWKYCDSAVAKYLLNGFYAILFHPFYM